MPMASGVVNDCGSVSELRILDSLQDIWWGYTAAISAADGVYEIIHAHVKGFPFYVSLEGSHIVSRIPYPLY